MQSIITKLTNAVKEVLKKDNTIDDIILFGSSMKGKTSPHDIDILIIFKIKINKDSEKLLKNLAKVDNLDINSITINEMKNEDFIAREGIYLEGYSLVNKKSINESMGFHSVSFVKYDLSKLKGSKRIRFYYALQGRGKEKGFLKEIHAKRFSESVILCDYTEIEKLKDFLEQWGLEYIIIPSLIPERLKKIVLN